jgi:hypothetical protein
MRTRIKHRSFVPFPSETAYKKTYFLSLIQNGLEGQDKDLTLRLNEIHLLAEGMGALIADQLLQSSAEHIRSAAMLDLHQLSGVKDGFFRTPMPSV